MISMTRSFSIVGVSTIYLLMTITASFADKELKITKAQVLKLLQSVEEAINKRDVGGIVGHIAPNATIKLQMPGPNGSQTFRWTTKEYEDYLNTAFAQISDYGYKRADTKIEIAKNGQTARVTETVFETMSMGGGMIRAEVKETTLLGLQKGKLLVTAIEAVIISIK